MPYVVNVNWSTSRATAYAPGCPRGRQPRNGFASGDYWYTFKVRGDIEQVLAEHAREGVRVVGWCRCGHCRARSGKLKGRPDRPPRRPEFRGCPQEITGFTAPLALGSAGMIGLNVPWMSNASSGSPRLETDTKTVPLDLANCDPT
jgi:hypothetical protein